MKCIRRVGLSLPIMVFGSQVVDGNTGVHAIIKKGMFESRGLKMEAAV